METKTRYFEIRSPQTDFTGRMGAISFADGVARVSFDDARDEHGRSILDEHKVQVGRSAVMFAKRRGYKVTETNAAGVPLDELPKEKAKQEAKEKAKSGDSAPPAKPAKSATKAEWKAYAIAQGMPEADADAATRDQLAELYAEGGNDA